ncbi:MAG: GAF domain-containing protein [Phycisphaerales bacterium]
MTPGNEHHNTQPVAGAADTGTPSLPVRVLIVSGSGRERVRLTRMLSRHVEELGVAHSADEAREALGANAYDLAIVGRHQPDGCGIELTEELRGMCAALEAVVITDSPTLDDAVGAMRAGAVDMLDSLSPTRDLGDRIAAAARKARASREQHERTRRLQRLCKRLNQAREEVADHVGSLCSELTEAYQSLSSQIGDASISSELNSLLRQELDVESLLRTLLEFMLAKMGATNAGVFLPSTSGDFSLGAYVNHDQPRDTSEMLFDHLADAVAPRFEDQTEVLVLNTPELVDSHFGDDAHWIGDSSAVVVSCGADDECLAVLVLFRDRSRPYSEQDVRLVEMISRLFGAQLARVIKVHHRHLPEEEWGRFDPEVDEQDEGWDDYGLAA